MLKHACSLGFNPYSKTGKDPIWMMKLHEIMMAILLPIVLMVEPEPRSVVIPPNRKDVAARQDIAISLSPGMRMMFQARMAVSVVLLFH